MEDTPTRLTSTDNRTYREQTQLSTVRPNQITHGGSMSSINRNASPRKFVQNSDELRVEIPIGEDGFRWLVLRQADRSKPCRYGPCSRCLNTGFGFTDILIKGYLWEMSPAFSFPMAAGIISTSVKNLVVKFNRPLQKFDQVIEISLDPDTGEVVQPFEIIRTYLLSDANPLRGKGGRVEFWSAIAEERTLTDDRRGEEGPGYQHTSNR